MDYEQFKIKTYDLWGLYLHIEQFPYIGRCYAAATREEADFVTDMTELESKELFSNIIPEWHNAVSELYGPSRPNVAILGNLWNHLHAHLIPRFTDVRTAYDIEFIDPNPTGNYAPHPKKDISLDILLKIKEDIKQVL